MKRRAFLQSGTACLTALGVSNLVLGNCQAALASAVGRKVALLIGIDDYGTDNLKGCLTDVALQSHLFQQCFGFAADNVIQLVNQAATVEQLRTVISEQLMQLQPSDLLVIHFSGKGDLTGEMQPTLRLSGNQELPLKQLGMLLGMLPTKRLITVLDTSYVAGTQFIQGGVRCRAVGEGNISLPTFTATFPGIVLSPLAADEASVEIDYPEFSAGCFTYSLTQALWRHEQLPGDQVLGLASATKSDRKALDGLLADRVMPASIGAFNHLDSTATTGEVWLGGLLPEKLGAINPLALLQTAGDQTVQVTARQGLKATVRSKGDATTPLTLTTALSEQLRTIPQALSVQIAIDHSLSKIERIDAVGALSGLSNVNAKVVGEGAADYILAKVQAADANRLIASLPDMSLKDVVPSPHYALLTLDSQQISTTSTEADEAVKTTVKRFAPIVEALYAEKLLGLLENQASSNLAVSVEVDRLTPQPKLFLQQSTAIAQVKPTDMLALPSLPTGTQLNYRVTSRAASQLYWLVVGWNSRRDSYIVLPPVDRTSAVLDTGVPLKLPLRSDGSEWSVRGPAGPSVMHLVMSDRPFVQTAAALKLENPQPDSYLHSLEQPITVMQALLKDLSAPDFDSSDSYGLDMNRYAILPMRYQVA